MPAATPELEARLGLTEALSIVIGRIIGSGIFRTPGPMMLAVSGLDASATYTTGDIPVGQISIGLFFLAWIIGGIATFLSSFCFAELVAMIPRSGGPYAYLKAAYPEFWTFLRGWAMFFVSETASIVAVALVFSEYTDYALRTSGGSGIGLVGRTGLALGIIWLLTAANSFGVLASGMLQNVLSFLKVASLIAIIGFCFAAPGESINFTTNVWPEEWTYGTVLTVLTALRYGFFAYSGWEGATYVAEEVRNPRRNLPLSLFLGIGGVMLIYLAVNSAYLYQLGAVEMILARKEIASRAMQVSVGTAGGLLLAGIVMLSTFGNVSTQIMVKARTWHAMARDGLFFRFVRDTSPRWHTPNRALILQAGWASVLLIVAALDTGIGGGTIYEKVIDFFSFTSGI
ncbi:MAG: amino acid permease, partial [Leptospiraceae bacterium]|nr:amino acid permease [Leptospiraceae bacterium]